MVDSLDSLGAELRALRLSCGLSGVAAARGVGWTQSKLSRVETGAFRATMAQVADLLDYYDAPEELRAELLARVDQRDGPAGAWVVRAGGTRRRTASLGDIELRASRVRQYAAMLVPGLLQAPEYTVALLRAGGWESPDDVAAKRQERRARLAHADAFDYQVVLDARALMRWPGDSAVMAAQLDHLLSLPKSVDLRVLPTGPAGTALVGSFVAYEFAEGDPVVVLCETQTADLYLSGPADVATYTRLMDELLDASLTVKDSASYLREISRTLREND